MARGTVKWFNSQKGYGFIQPQDGGRDVFIHISAIEKAGLPGLNEGQVVEYELVTNRGKTSAENLKVSRWDQYGKTWLGPARQRRGFSFRDRLPACLGDRDHDNPNCLSARPLDQAQPGRRKSGANQIRREIRSEAMLQHDSLGATIGAAR
jgi:cold shock protein